MNYFWLILDRRFKLIVGNNCFWLINWGQAEYGDNEATLIGREKVLAKTFKPANCCILFVNKLPIWLSYLRKSG